MRRDLLMVRQGGSTSTRLSLRGLAFCFYLDTVTGFARLGGSPDRVWLRAIARHAQLLVTSKYASILVRFNLFQGGIFVAVDAGHEPLNFFVACHRLLLLGMIGPFHFARAELLSNGHCLNDLGVITRVFANADSLLDPGANRHHCCRVPAEQNENHLVGCRLVPAAIRRSRFVFLQHYFPGIPSTPP